MVVKLKMCTTGKCFSQICLKTIRETFFPIYGVRSKKGQRETSKKLWGLNFLTWEWHLNFRHEREVSLVFPLVGNPEPPIRNTLRIYLGMLTVMTLKKLCENIFFESNKLTAYKVKHGKEVKNFFNGGQSIKDYPSISR